MLVIFRIYIKIFSLLHNFNLGSLFLHLHFKNHFYSNCPHFQQQSLCHYQNHFLSSSELFEIGHFQDILFGHFIPKHKYILSECQNDYGWFQSLMVMIYLKIFPCNQLIFVLYILKPGNSVCNSLALLSFPDKFSLQSLQQPSLFSIRLLG